VCAVRSDLRTTRTVAPMAIFVSRAVLRSDHRAICCRADRRAISLDGNCLIRLSGCLKREGRAVAPLQAIVATAVYPDASQLLGIAFSQVPTEPSYAFRFHVRKVLSYTLTCTLTIGCCSVSPPSARPLSESSWRWSLRASLEIELNFLLRSAKPSARKR
jgi:hypothetical protein